jgi:hypothetical protein
MTIDQTLNVSSIAEHALVPIGQIDTLPLLLDDTFAFLDQEIRAARLQIARGAHEFAEGMTRLALALIKMRTRQRYRDAGYSTFAEYLEQCHALSEDAALDCIQALQTLGADDYRTLLANAGAMRTHAMTIIKQMAPHRYMELMALGADGERPLVAAMPVSELEENIATLKAALEESYTHYDQVLGQLTSAKHIVANSGERMQQIKEINQSLVIERDQALKERDELKKNSKTPPKADPKVVKQLKEENKDLRDQLTAATDALNFSHPTPPPRKVVDVARIVDTQCDPELLAEVVRLCVTALERYRAIAPQVAPEQAHALTAAIAQIVATSTLPLLSPVITAVATALQGMHDVEHDAEALPPLVRALDALGAAAMPIYERGRSDGRA